MSRSSRLMTSNVFLSRVDRSGGCWIYPAKPNHDGYVRVTVDGHKWMSHRFVLFIAGVDLPAGYEVDHLCRNRACCNPSHLEVVNHLTNMERGFGMDRINAAKTVCKRGHPFDRVNADGSRGCSICSKAYFKVYDAMRPPRKRALTEFADITALLQDLTDTVAGYDEGEK